MTLLKPHQELKDFANRTASLVTTAEQLRRDGIGLYEVHSQHRFRLWELMAAVVLHHVEGDADEAQPYIDTIREPSLMLPYQRFDPNGRRELGVTVSGESGHAEPTLTTFVHLGGSAVMGLGVDLRFPREEHVIRMNCQPVNGPVYVYTDAEVDLSDLAGPSYEPFKMGLSIVDTLNNQLAWAVEQPI